MKQSFKFGLLSLCLITASSKAADAPSPLIKLQNIPVTLPATAPRSEDTGAPKEITFKESLIIHHKGLVRDGGTLEHVPCDAEMGGAIVGYIQLDEKNRLELSCIDDYAGGMYLQAKNGKNKIVSEKVGEFSNVAGDAVDTRTWITKKDGTFKMESISYSSKETAGFEEEAEGDKKAEPAASATDKDAASVAASASPIHCEKKSWMVEFDTKTKKFKRQIATMESAEKRFIPAPRVAEKCAL